MAQQTPRPNRDRDPNGGGTPEPNFNWRGLLLFAAAILLIGGGFYLRGPNSNSKNLTNTEFDRALADGRIVKEGFKIVSEGTSADWIRGTVLSSKDAPRGDAFRTQINPNYASQDLMKRLKEHGIVPEFESGSNNMVVAMLVNFLPVAFILLLLYFFFRQ